MRLNTYSQAFKYLFSHIPDSSTRVYSGEMGLKRMKHLAHLLGDPQDKIPVIHIAGTSGKGSTATMISEILTAHGLTVGLHISPHLVDIRERFQINRKLISKELFVSTLNEIVPAIETMKSTEYGEPTYFEINTALAYLIFVKKKVDVAVIETGLGGLLDGTNIVSRQDKLCVITRIGLDHTEILGKTLSEIAFQKAGIIQSGNAVLTIRQAPEVIEVLDDVVAQKNTSVNIVETDNSLELGVRGAFQKENASLAIASAKQWMVQNNRNPDDALIKKTLKNIIILGRFDIRHIKNKTVIIDGAHNPEKMNAFINSLIKLYPGAKFDFILAFKKGKNYAEMLPLLLPMTQSLTLTRFSSSQQEALDMSEDPEKIKQVALELGFKNVQLSPSPKKALIDALSSTAKIIVITGSIYLQEEIYQYLEAL